MNEKPARRDVLRMGLGAAASAIAIRSCTPQVVCAAQPVPRVSSQQTYQATVPDTLDLAERARLALRGIANTVDPEDEFQMWFDVLWNNNPPYLRHSGCDVECTPKFLDAMTLLRLACGSNEFRDIEQGMAKNLLKHLDPHDGLYYALYRPYRKWHMTAYADKGYQTKPEDYALPGSSGIMLTAMVLRNELGLTPCEEQIRSLVRGLEKIAIVKDDYAYYPEGGNAGHPFACTRAGWKDTREPVGERESGEGTVVAYFGYQIRGLSMWAQRTGDQQALDFAGKLVRFIMKPKFWGNPADPPHVIGSQQGHIDSHFHARAIALRGLLEYGIVSGNSRICNFVRSAYEYMRSFGISSIGYIPCWPDRGRATMETCLLGDLVALTIKMSRAGIGDYWDDADCIIRNHLAEAQLLCRDLIDRVIHDSPQRKPQGYPGQISTERVIDRIIGIFGSYLLPTCIVSNSRDTDPITGGQIMQCCTANAARGIAYAWDGILEANGNQVQINLLLNRASPWLDINSYLPYEGKVVILNKTARRVAIRIPSCIQRTNIRARVNGSERHTSWIGACQVFDELKPGDTLQIDFPVPQQTVYLSARTGTNGPNKNTTYTITFRGNTVVDIAPRDPSPAAYPMYQRNFSTFNKAPMKTVERFVTTKIVRW